MLDKNWNIIIVLKWLNDNAEQISTFFFYVASDYSAIGVANQLNDFEREDETMNETSTSSTYKWVNNYKWFIVVDGMSLISSVYKYRNNKAMIGLLDVEETM